MKKVVLFYSFIVVVSLNTMGCASNLHTNRGVVAGNLPKVVNLPTNHQQNNPVIPQIKHSNETLVDFIRHYNKRLLDQKTVEIANVILRVSQVYRIDYRLLTALVAVESSFRTDAVSSSGALGLGQLMPATARSLNVINPYDPYDNLNGAAKLLRSHLEKYQGDVNYALACYKIGGGAVARQGINQPSTVDYIKRVKTIFNQVP